MSETMICGDMANPELREKANRECRRQGLIEPFQSDGIARLFHAQGIIQHSQDNGIKMVECPSCYGSGMDSQRGTCGRCGGLGQVPDRG